MTHDETTHHLPETTSWNLKGARDDLGSARCYVTAALLMLKGLPISDNHRKAIEVVTSDALDRMDCAAEGLDIVLAPEGAA